MARVTISEALTRKYETCVIGAGAAGLALALALGKAGQQVLLIERGGCDSGNIQAPDDLFEINSPRTHDPRQKTNREAVGGTLHGWGGRCVPFDPEDFGPRPELCLPGWPISYQEYAQWISAAAQFLQTDNRFDEPDPIGWTGVPGVRVDRVERLNDARQVHKLQARLQDETNTFDLLERTDLVGTIWAGQQGARRVKMLELDHGGERFSLPCKRIILACGGLETTRQLLMAQQHHPDLFGGPNGPLGRYYMGHLTGSIATITFKDAILARGFAYAQTPDLKSPYRRRFTLTDDAPSNTAFWLENLAAHAADHHSGEISFKHLVAQRGRTPQAMAHLANMLRDPGGISDALRSFSTRIAQRNLRHPPRLVTRRGKTFALAYHAEHFPVRDSRVVLSKSTDQLGRRKLAIDFKYGDETISALLKCHLMLARRLAQAGVAKINMPAHDQLASAIENQARDGYHQAGLARMSNMPGDGVVDPTCRAHGTDNMYAASAAVFPVSGQANPTLSVVALALRLAHSLTATP